MAARTSPRNTGGAKCVLGALQFGNDPGFSKHDWDCDDYTECFTCTSLPLNRSELTHLVA